MKYQMQLEFDGTDYAGWLYQPDRVTVQGTIQNMLSELCQEPIEVMGCSRTDSGVHAAEYYVHFETNQLQIPLDQCHRVFNSHLPRDIVVHSVSECAEDLHVLRSAKRKTYTYTILNQALSSVFERRFATHVTYPLDVDLMQQAANDLIGEHDFKSFCCEPERKQHHKRHIYSLEVKKSNHFIVIHVTANGFLYNMVRIIVGTLIEIGRGHLAKGSIPAILAAQNRAAAGPTAPPQGLCLKETDYED